MPTTSPSSWQQVTVHNIVDMTVSRTVQTNTLEIHHDIFNFNVKYVVLRRIHAPYLSHLLQQAYIYFHSLQTKCQGQKNQNVSFI